MKPMLRLLFLTLGLCTLFGIGNEAIASHIPGANITYTCNPTNPLQYTFRLTLFRTCPGTHPNTMSGSYFTFTNSCGLTNPISPVFNQVGVEVDVNQLCSSATSNCSGGSDPGIYMYTYEATVTLPANCDGWTLTYSLCCRDASSNVSGSSSQNMVTTTTLNTLTAPCNNSPTVTSAPIPYACTNTNFSYCLTTQDAEGDSVTFQMQTPYGANLTLLTHLAGYSTNAPLNNFALDPLTGCITFNHPTTGNYVVAIRINSYNAAGQLIASIVHDFQVMVISCSNTPPTNPTGGITNFSGSGTQISSNTVAACYGDAFCFDVVFQDNVNLTDVLTITENGTTLLPGSTFTQTGTNPVTGTFCWTAQPGYTGSIITFVANDNGCPVMGSTGFAVDFNIATGVYAGPDITICGTQTAQLLGQGAGTYTWSPSTGLSCTNCANPVANPAVTTSYIVTGGLVGSCPNSDTITVFRVPTFPVTVTPASATICANGAVQLNAGGPLASGPFTYLWTPSAALNATDIGNPIATPMTSTNYIVSVTAANGCTQSTNIPITVSGIGPTVSINPSDTNICAGVPVSITSTASVYPLVCGVSSGCTGTNSTFDLGANTSSTTTYSPFAGSTSTGTNYNTKMQFIFTAAELNAMGYFGGTIRSIAFYNSSSYAYTYNNVTISMGCTNQTEYTGTSFLTGLTQVFGPVNNFNPADNNWQTFNIADFDWDGVSNIVIQFCAEENTAGTSGWESIQYSSITPAYRYMYYYSTIAGAACPSATGNRVVNRPNMRFDICEQTVNSPIYAWSPAAGLSSTSVPNPIAAPTTTTTYLLNVTDGASGCVGSAIAQFNVSPNYSLNTVATTSNICYGASTTISSTPSVAGSYTYLWEPSGSLTAPTSQSSAASPPATTTYTVTVSNGNCVRTDDITINVSGGPVGIYASEDTVCPGTPVLLDVWNMPQTCGLNTTGCMGITNNHQVGNGTFATSTYSPFYGSYADYKIQLLYTAAELQAMGMTAGTITDLAFNVINKYTTGPFTNYTVSIGCTNAAALTNTAWEATAGVVYGPANYTTAVGWNTIPFTTGFDWDGVSNIVVEICWDMSVAISYDNIEYHTTSFISLVRNYNSAGLPGCSLPPAYQYSARPNTRFTLCGGGLPAGATYAWSPSTNLSDPGIQNPTANMWGDITYTVSVTDPANPGCPGIGTRTLSIDHTNNVAATPDTALCAGAGASIQLNSVYTGPLPAITKPCGTGSTCSGTTVTAALGTATSSTSSYTPFYGSSVTTTDYDAKAQYIFTAAELTAAGLNTGVIRDLSIFITTINAFSYDNFTIYIGCTNQNEYDATATFIPTGSLTQVYGPINNFNPIDNAWNTFNIADFGWDGVSNIVVQLCASEDNVEANNGYNSARYSSTAPYYRCLYYYSGTVTNICNYATGYRTTARPNVQFNVCSEFPTNPTYAWSPAGTLNNPSIGNPLATPVATTDYIVTATGGNCVVYDTVTIVLSTPSTPPTIPAMGTVCPNTPVTLTAGGGTAGAGSTIEWYTGPNGTGTWLGSGANYTFTPTGTTTVYARREGGCNNTADANTVVDLRDYIYAANGTSSNTYCTDNAGWHHFYAGDDIIFSVQGDLSGAPAGFPVATIYDNGVYYQQAQGPLTATSCVNGWTPGEEWFEMERSWNLDFGTGAPIGTYDVRFYYQPAERQAIENAANNWMATYSACGYAYKYPYPLGFYWFKNTGSNYTAPDYDGTHLMPATTNVTGTPNAVNYSQISGITGFSGGSGGITLVPTNPLLPVEWLYFTGNTDGKVNNLRWATATETNSSHFNLQRSKDGISFETIAVIAAQGNSSTATHYSYKDENPFTGINYYRLELEDVDGSIEKSNIVSLLISKDNSGYAFYPNPTDDVVFYQYQAVAAEDLKIEVIDALGRVLQVYNRTAAIGVNNIAIDLEDYPAGTYMLRVHNQGSGNTHIAKVVKRGL